LKFGKNKKFWTKNLKISNFKKQKSQFQKNEKQNLKISKIKKPIISN
jgi:hypothetical protein